jgi:hypothetical protein
MDCQPQADFVRKLPLAGGWRQSARMSPIRVGRSAAIETDASPLRWAGWLWSPTGAFSWGDLGEHPLSDLIGERTRNRGDDESRRSSLMIAKATESARKSDIRIAPANRVTERAVAGLALTGSAVMPSLCSTDRGSNTECEMSELFETDSGSTKRKETGSRFVLNTTPIDFAKYNAFYENPVYGLNIGILAIFTSEIFELKSTYGHVVQQPVRESFWKEDD